MDPNLILVILALVALAIGFMIGRATSSTSGRPPALHRIAISETTTPPGVEVDPDRVTVYPGDAIAWVAGAGDWSVRLPDKLAVVPSVVRGARGDTALAQVAARANPGEYKYSVTLMAGGKSIDLDPLVVVRKDEKIDSE